MKSQSSCGRQYTQRRLHLSVTEILRQFTPIFKKILKSGGSVLLDVYSLNAFNQKEERTEFEVNMLNGFWSSNKYYGFLNTFKYEKEKVVLDKYTIIEKDRTRRVYNWLQHFSPEDLEKEFEGAGFIIEGVYSDVAGTNYDSKSSEFAVVAKRL